MSSNTKNYTAQGGSLTVIGGELQILGKLIIDPEAEVEGLFGVPSQGIAEAVEFKPIEAYDSTATSVAQLRDDFNALLGKLRAGGILADGREHAASALDGAEP